MNPTHIGYVPLRQALRRVTANPNPAYTAGHPGQDPVQTLVRGVERLCVAYDITRSGGGYQAMTAQVFYDYGIHLIAQAIESIDAVNRYTYDRTELDNSYDTSEVIVTASGHRIEPEDIGGYPLGKPVTR